MHVPLALSETLPQCMHTRCADRHTKSECLGVMDCEWCVLENDGKTPLGKPFCSTQRVCFAGALGATTPYRDEIMGMSHQANSKFHLLRLCNDSSEVKKVELWESLAILSMSRNHFFMQMGDENFSLVKLTLGG